MNLITDRKEGHDVDHFAVAVYDISVATRRYVDVLGAEIVHDEIIESQGVNVRFLQTEDAMYELLEPLSNDSPIARFLTKRGEGLHHIAYRVDDIHHEYERLLTLGLQLLQQAPVEGARNKLIFFIHPHDMGGILTEICQQR